MVSQWIRLIEGDYFEITMPMITLDSRVESVHSVIKSYPQCYNAFGFFTSYLTTELEQENKQA